MQDAVQDLRPGLGSTASTTEVPVESEKVMAEKKVEDFVHNTSEKPSTSFHGDLYVARLYNDDSVDPHVYEHVKHVWYKNNGQTICICHFYDDGRYRFVFFQANSVRWMQVWPERFEAGRGG